MTGVSEGLMEEEIVGEVGDAVKIELGAFVIGDVVVGAAVMGKSVPGADGEFVMGEVVTGPEVAGILVLGKTVGESVEGVIGVCELR